MIQTINHKNRKMTCTLSGYADMADAVSLHRSLVRYLRKTTDIRFDLAKVQSMHPACLQVLLSLFKTTAGTPTRVSITPGQIKKLNLFMGQAGLNNDTVSGTGMTGKKST